EDASGNLTVSGSGSALVDVSTEPGNGSMAVGFFGDGSLEILDGGKVFSNKAVIANGALSSSKVKVAGLGSVWEITRDLSIAYQGSGQMSITAGGLVTSGSGFVASVSGATGSVTIDGPGSEWHIAGNLSVGGVGTITGGTGIVSTSDGGRLIVDGT